MSVIRDGASNKAAGVDASGRLSARTVQQTETENATDTGGSFNVNTGLITLTTAGESGVLYMKNNEDQNIHIDSAIVIFGPSTGGATTDTTQVRIYRNPTTGTLISTATDVDVLQNRNFGSSKTLTADTYKGTEGSTITDGDVVIESLVSPGSRVAFNIDMVLTKGDSISISYEPNDSNTSMKVMAAYACHIEPIL